MYATSPFTRLEPQPPRGDNMYWRGHGHEKGAVYGVTCPGSNSARAIFIPDAADVPAPDEPVIDPEVLARRAVDSMRLDGPVVASPRAAGRYLIGMPMWLWASPSPSTFGPVSASASAGSVTATVRVTSVRWTMGDGATVTCTGPGTPYQARYGAKDSPACGHRYTRPAEYEGTATSTWTVQWEAPALGDSGTLTETRTTPFTAWVGEAQALGTG